MSLNEFKSISLALYGKKVEVTFRDDSRNQENHVKGILIERKWGHKQMGDLELDTVVGIALLLEEGVETEIPIERVVHIKEITEYQ